MNFDHITTKACAVANRNPASGQVTPLIATTTPKPCGDLEPEIIDFWIEPGSIRLDKNPGQLKGFVQTGETFGFWAWAFYSDGTYEDVTEEATWSGNNDGAATVSDTDGSKGVATGVLPAPVGGGSADDEVTVTATWEGKTDSALLTVYSLCEDTELDIVLVLDRSGSMDVPGLSGQSRLEAVKEAAQTMINNMNATRDQIGIVSYAGKVWLSTAGAITGTEGDATLDSIMLGYSDKATLLDRLDLYELRGDCTAHNPSVCCTGIGAGMEAAMDELQSSRARSGAQKVMIVMTDGAENINDPPPDEVAADAAAAGITVVVVGVDVPTTYEASLRALANPSDKAYMVNTGEDVKAIFASIPNIVCNEHTGYGDDGYGNLPCSGLTITETSLPAGTDGVAYSQTLHAAGGTSPYTFEKVSGPAWLSVSSAGVISGTPSASGTSTVSVKVSDSTYGVCEYTKLYVLNIQAAGATYDWTLDSFVRVCEGDSPSDQAGPWDVFAPNGDGDFHWRLTLTTGPTALTVHKLLVQNTNSAGTNVLHQYWSNLDDVPPEWPSGARHYPLVLIDSDGNQLNDAYDEEITLSANTTHVLELYGQAVVPATSVVDDPTSSTAYWKVTLTDDDTNSESLLSANPCSDSPCTPRCLYNLQPTMGETPSESATDISDFFKADYGGSAVNSHSRWRIVCWEGGEIPPQVIAGFGCGNYYDYASAYDVLPLETDLINGQFDSNGIPTWTAGCPAADLANPTVSYCKVETAAGVYSLKFLRPAYQYIRVFVQIGCIDGSNNITFLNA